jgi:Fe-S-cluster containining protein
MATQNPIEAVMRFHDSELKQIRERYFREGRPIRVTCTKGCAACCEELLHVSELETRLIVESLTEAQKEEVRQRVQHWLDQIGDRLDDREPDGLEYRSWRIPCPLLKNGLCSVHDKRPLKCRSTLTDGLRKACEDLTLRPTQRFIDIPELKQAVADRLLHAHVAAGYKEFKFGHLGMMLAEHLGLTVPAREKIADLPANQ